MVLKYMYILKHVKLVLWNLALLLTWEIFFQSYNKRPRRLSVSVNAVLRDGMQLLPGLSVLPSSSKNMCKLICKYIYV